MKTDIWSPCIKVCLVDPESRTCVGCFRTLEELGRWTKLTGAEREAVRPKLDVRKADYLSRRASGGGKTSAAPEASMSACAKPAGAPDCTGPAECAAMGVDCPALNES